MKNNKNKKRNKKKEGKMKINKKAERYMMDENKNKNRYISFTLHLISRRQKIDTSFLFKR